MERYHIIKSALGGSTVYDSAGNQVGYSLPAILRICKHEIIGGRELPDMPDSDPVKEILLRAFCPRIPLEEFPVAQEQVISQSIRAVYREARVYVPGQRCRVIA